MNRWIDKPLNFRFHDAPGSIKRYVSAEIEVARMNCAAEDALYCCISKWGGAICADGSLPNSGFEINTAPARGLAFIEQINEICGILKAGKARVTQSCGLHVHTDARDFNAEDLVKIAILWSKIEPKMYDKVNESRKSSQYCRPWNEYLLSNIDFKKDTSTQAFFKMYDTIGEARYRSLNFAAFKKFGTLENRLMQGTVSTKKIIGWADLNSKILEFAKNTDFKKILKYKAEDGSLTV